jgi:hypothetical protein
MFNNINDKEVKILFIPYIILIFIAIWWLFGRTPYLTINSYDDYVLSYHEPNIFGYSSRGIKWSSNPPKYIKDDWPDAKGWWCVVSQVGNISDAKSLDDVEKCFKFVPLGYHE